MRQTAIAEAPAVKNGKAMATNLTDFYGGGIRMVPSVQAMFDFMYGDLSISSCGAVGAFHRLPPICFSLMQSRGLICKERQLFEKSI